MTSPLELQYALQALGAYSGPLDGLLGPASRAALIAGMRAKRAPPLAPEDFYGAAKVLGCSPNALRAVVQVESGVSGFDRDNRPLILPEPHRFSAMTGRVWDRQFPHLSYPKWGTRPYPRTPDERWRILTSMVALDVDAGFSACSYGRFQILGSNFKACGYRSSMEHALTHATGEQAQLMAFVNFVRAQPRLHESLSGLRSGPRSPACTTDRPTRRTSTTPACSRPTWPPRS